MRTTHVALIGGVAIAGVAAIFYFKNKSLIGAGPTSYYPGVTGSDPYNTGSIYSSGSNLYPYQNIGGPGATQSNQPWSNGALRPNIGPGVDINVQNLQNISSGLSSVNSIFQSAGDLWGSVSGWFGSDDEGPDTGYVLGQGYSLDY